MHPTDAIFYHIYALGALGVLDGPRDQRNPSPISRIGDWIPAMRRVGANTMLLGPVFESEYHGYDTVDLRKVDRRLGSNQDLVELSARLRGEGMRLVLDAVLNHVGRSHPLVQEVAREGARSPKARWIAGFDPAGPGRGGLPFAYTDWNGNHDLVKLDTGNREVRAWLTESVIGWIDEFGISGLRIDAADCIDREFLRILGERCRERDPSFFFVGEAVHGDHYASLLEESNLDAVTDYEAYKGLWSSHNDRNFHEIAWSLDRLFGARGLCRGKMLYSFADNHDVDRVASTLRDPAHLHTLYGLLFSMPGIPSIYYGSEFGISGRRAPGDDRSLRPSLDPRTIPFQAPHPDLARSIARFAAARRASRATRTGSYRQLHVEMEGIAFLREDEGDLAAIALNASENPLTIPVKNDALAGRTLRDLLDEGFRLRCDGQGRATIPIHPRWLRWLVPEGP